MFETILTTAAPLSDPFKAGPYNVIAEDSYNTAFLSGTFGASATVTLEATPIDPASDGFVADDWFTVPEISVTSKGIVQPGVKAAYFRWRLTGGNGSTAVKVRMLTTSDAAAETV